MEKYLRKYRNEKNFNTKDWINMKIQKFNYYLKTNNLSGAVLSVSGGIDSAVTLALLKKTLELKNSKLKKILAINQPIHSSDWALNRAKELCEKMNIELKVVDQTETYNNLTSIVTDSTGLSPNKFSGGQLRSYMRTPINYYCAQLLTQEGYPSLVMGTGNQDEDGYLAYFCKAGDGVVDVQLISDLHKSEVYKVGKKLGVPSSILEAAPSADLWDNQKDEEELDFTYDFIEFYTGYYLKLAEIEKLEFLNKLNDNERRDFENNVKKCESVHKRNKHKLNGVINL